MKYIKKFEGRKKKPVYYDYYNNFLNDIKKIKDVKYYIDIISGDILNVTQDTLSHMFFYSCREFPELALEMTNHISSYIINKGVRGIAQIDFEYFKKMLQKNDDLINNSNLVEEILYYGNSKLEKIKFLKSLGYILTPDLLRSACYIGNLELTKYLVEQGFDPNEKKEAKWTHAPENCLDLSTEYNKTPEVIKYLVEDMGVPVTYRHIKNIIQQNNLDALPILVNVKDFEEDYAYSNYATNSDNKKPIKLSFIIPMMCNKDLYDYLKIILSKEKDFGYQLLQSLPKIEKFNTEKWKHEDPYITIENAELAYWVINNYDGKYENSYTTKFITRKNEKFWLKKMKKEPSIVQKLKNLDENFKSSYEYQKTILDLDTNNLNIIINILNPKIEKEFDFLIAAKKYNI